MITSEPLRIGRPIDITTLEINNKIHGSLMVEGKSIEHGIEYEIM